MTYGSSLIQAKRMKYKRAVENGMDEIDKCSTIARTAEEFEEDMRGTEGGRSREALLYCVSEEAEQNELRRVTRKRKS